MERKVPTDKVNVLLVDDQPDKLLAYEVILGQLGENLVKTSSAREALQFLLKNDLGHKELPIVVYTGKDLSRTEETELRRVAEAIVVKGVKSP